jgi:DNA adenine methylase
VPDPGGPLRAPFPYFGGKSRIAEAVWARLGEVDNYVEPFAGSLAVLLARPATHQWWRRVETVGDQDALLANFWRAVQADPEVVAGYADWPVNEVDLEARHRWLVSERHRLAERLLGDPDVYDPRAAGWWVWGISAWVGGGWCSGQGPWAASPGADGPSDGGGSGWVGDGVYRKLPAVAGDHPGRGIHRLPAALAAPGIPLPAGELPDVRAAGRAQLLTSMQALANRLRRVRVTCGDWTRLTGSAITHRAGITGVFLDPPYSHDVRRGDLYAVEHAQLADQVHAWALAHGDHPQLRLALCTYASPDLDQVMQAAGWTSLAWVAHGGYGLIAHNRAHTNRALERVWFSPSCLDGSPPARLFDPDQEGGR